MTDRAQTRSMRRNKENLSPERKGSGLDGQVTEDGQVSPSGSVVPEGGTGSVGPTLAVTTPHGSNTESGNIAPVLVNEKGGMSSMRLACNTR